MACTTAFPEVGTMANVQLDYWLDHELRRASTESFYRTERAKNRVLQRF
jgi:hypothetical protein